MNNIQEIAVGKIEGVYTVPLTESDKLRLKDEVVSASTTFQIKKQNKKDIDKELTAELNQIEDGLKNNLETYNSGVMRKTGTLYLVPNFEDGMMEFYDELGTLIESQTRRLRPDERQETLRLAVNNS